MNHFVLQYGRSVELLLFPHIAAFSFQKIQQVVIGSFELQQVSHIHIFCITDGKFEWNIEGREYILFPGDVALVMPGQSIGSNKGHYDTGTFYHIKIVVDSTGEEGRWLPGNWSGISEKDIGSIIKLFALSNVSVIPKQDRSVELFHQLRKEIFEQEIGFATRVNQLLDEILITLVRHLTRQSSSQRDFPKSFMKLEEALRKNLDHQWLVEEMAVLVGLGTTAFTEKVKSYTGFAPLHYLINIRIAEAIKQLKQTDKNITDIALDTGFYSSQHFATTFKKLTGYTPRHFRQNNNK